MIDLAIVTIYMVTVLFVGIFSGFRIRSVEEYSVSKNSFTTFVLIAAIFATLIGGGATMGVSEKTFSSGLVFVVSCMGFIVRDLLTAWLIAPHMQKFAGCYTAGDILGKFYGKKVKIFVGIAGTLQTNAALSMQVSAMGHLMSYFFDITYSTGIIIGAGTVVLYSSFGGIKAVTFTDVIQFCVLIVAIPVTFIIGMHTVGGYDGLWHSLPKEKLSLIPQTGDAVRFYSLFFVFCIPYVCPAILQRMLMGKDTKQVRQALVISALSRLPYFIMVGLLGLVAYVINPSLKGDLAFPYLVNEILPVGIKGFVIAGLLAVIMSTADSYLHLTGLMFCHDVIKPIFADKLDDKKELILLRICTLMLGCLSVFGAFYNSNLIDLNIFSYIFWLPAIFIPLFSAIHGIYGSSLGFYISGLSGILMMVLWKHYFYPITMIDALLPSSMASFVVFYLFYYIEKTYILKQRSMVYKL